MSNFYHYKNHVLAKNSDAFSMLSQAEKATDAKQRQVLFKKLDAHLKQVDENYKQLIK